jgi:hypothetical protein
MSDAVVGGVPTSDTILIVARRANLVATVSYLPGPIRIGYPCRGVQL